mgnify:CR=1 FL=1
MKIKELIEKLQKLDQELPVFAFDEGGMNSIELVQYYTVDEYEDCYDAINAGDKVVILTS